MQDKLLQTPDGVRDTYDVECKKKRKVMNELHHILELYSYHDIETPTLKKNLPVHMYILNRIAETAGQNSIAAVDAMRTIIFIMGIFMMLMNYPVRSCASV